MQPVVNRSGFALIVTLLVTSLMVAVAVEMIHQVYVDMTLSRGFRDGQQASILAESGVTGGAKLLQLGLASREYTSLSDPWAMPIKLDDETGTLEITVSEEGGKINLNGLVYANGEYEPFTYAALKRLGKRLQISESAWSSLADWLDGDDLPRSGGAETPYYRSLKPGYAARNGKLTTVTELLLVRDFSADALARLRPFVTTYSGQAGAPLSTININTASREVLAALDDRIDDRMADRIIEERRLQPFRSTAELSRIPGMDTVSIALQGKISAKGSLFRITSVARVKDAGRTVEAIVRVGNGTFEFLSWQEF
ncbi:MAG TPA: type II secretion system minor pseudopilin GspK [Desulfuromonadales bacterium]|nr:type II secretion system minor pseudopilin GspK [Desulfuromonadales bacterium]